MDALIAVARPHIDRTQILHRALEEVVLFLDEAREMGASAPPDQADLATAFGFQELWVLADRALVEAYSRALCGNAAATLGALVDGCGAAVELARALRRATFSLARCGSEPQPAQ
jgi:hypothetical protein